MKLAGKKKREREGEKKKTPDRHSKKKKKKNARADEAGDGEAPHARACGRLTTGWGRRVTPKAAISQQTQPRARLTQRSATAAMPTVNMAAEPQ